MVQSKPPESFGTFVDGKYDVTRPLHAAIVKRLTCLNTRDADAFRLLSGDREDLNGLVAEKFGNVIILQNSDMHPSLADSIKDIARWYKRTLGAEAVYYWDRSKPKSRGEKNRGGAGRDTSKPISQLLLGKHMPEEIAIKESGLMYGIKPGDGTAAGLFLDHRSNRMRIRSMSKDKDVLNLFAYTCGFSVAAVAGKANKAVSVDLSAKMLEWGKQNFERNNLSIEPHPFYASDSFEFLKRARRQEMLFDIIILDPPSFAHGRKRKQDFSISRDLATLVAEAASVLKPKGVMMVATNYRRMSFKGLRERVGKGARAAKRRYHVIETPKLPADFAVDPDHAKTIFVEFD